MSDFLTWRTQWQTGIDWIDGDHREIARLLNRLVAINDQAFSDPRARAANAPTSAVLSALEALIERTRRHFQKEEGFMREIGYPGFDEHRCEHVLQLAEFSELHRALEKDGGETLGPDTLEAFKRWFFNHVIAEDRGYADYYHDMIAARPAPKPSGPAP